MASELKVVSMQVRDVLGAREFALEPGKVTVLSGRNGSGKSSALGALQAALQGGNLAKLARVGAEGEEIDPEVVLVLEGSAGHFRVERGGKKVRVRRRVGDTAALEDVPQPQTWLSGLFDTEAANPVRILTAPEKELALLILEALPLSFDRAVCLDEIGITEEELRGFGPVPAGVLHPLEETAKIRESIFRARTGVNRDKASAEKSVERLQRAMPAKPPKDQAARIEALEASTSTLAQEIARAEEAADAAEREAVAAARSAYEQGESAVAADFKTHAGKLRREHEQRAAEVRTELERKIAELRAAADSQIAEDLAATNAAVEALREGGETEISQAEQARDEAIEEARAVRAQARERLDAQRRDLAAGREKLVELRAQQEEARRALTLREQVEQFEAEAERLRAESDRLTTALTSLDAHRRKLAEKLPIEGLAIDGPQVTRHGVPWAQLNSGQQVEIAVEIAVLRAQGDLPVVFVDGAERLDREHFDALVDELLKREVQAFIARVEDHDLEVESHEPPAEVVDLAGARG